MDKRKRKKKKAVRKKCSRRVPPAYLVIKRLPNHELVEEYHAAVIAQVNDRISRAVLGVSTFTSGDRTRARLLEIEIRLRLDGEQ